MKKVIALFFIIAFFVTAGVVFASPGNKYGKAVTPPFPQPAEKDLQKVVFIRYAPGFQKEKSCNYDGFCDPDEKWKFCSDCEKPGNGEEPSPTPTPTPTPEPTTCYDFLAGSKPRWNWVEDYAYSKSGLGTSSARAVTTWEGVTSGDIFGNGVHRSYPWGVYDYNNAISYGDYPEAGVIAVTAIWFRGKNIYEYDIMFDTDYFPGSIDLDTVVLHEFGHGAGLDDLYDVVCDGEVMYWKYLGVKTTLGSEDITGIQTLYGQ